uniref:HistoneH1 n=1 Tax=Anguilla japonica TaxID=7937 RepID=Q8JJC4_ANGJA|nr:histoneH1 [Anguilla japonica]
MARKKAAARPMKTCCSTTNVAALIVEAVSGSKEKSGVSMAALQKALTAGGYDVAHNVSRVKQAVKSLVSNGTLLQSKGPGAVCFILNAGSSQSPSKTRAAGSPSPKKTKKTTPRKAKRSPRKATRSPRKAKSARPKKAKTARRKK